MHLVAPVLVRQAEKLSAGDHPNALAKPLNRLMPTIRLAFSSGLLNPRTLGFPLKLKPRLDFLDERPVDFTI